MLVRFCLTLFMILALGKILVCINFCIAFHTCKNNDNLFLIIRIRQKRVAFCAGLIMKQLCKICNVIHSGKLNHTKILQAHTEKDD